MHIPAPLRAAVGLVVTAADEARRLPDRALELPMLAVSTALQASVRAQQRYARLTARGDAVLHRRPATDEPPAWATFDDDPLPPAALSRPQSPFDTVAQDFQPGDGAEQSARLFGELIGVDDPSTAAPNGANPTPAPEPTEMPPAARTPAKTQPAKTQAAKTQPRQPPAKKTAGRSTATPPTSAKSTTKSTAKSATKSAAKKSASTARRRTSPGSDAD